MIHRVQDTRFSYDLGNGASLEPITSNYYPMNAAIVSKMNASNEIWSVLSDRSQGGSKLHPDEMEVMVHRRLFHDDHLGVGEGLDEKAYGKPLVAIGKHYVYKNAQDNPMWRRLKAQENYMGPIAMFVPTNKTLGKI